MAIVYFFSDESGKSKKNRSVTVAGLGISRARLDRFEDEWKALLRSYELREFHMSRAAKIHETHGPKMPRWADTHRAPAGSIAFCGMHCQVF